MPIYQLTRTTAAGGHVLYASEAEWRCPGEDPDLIAGALEAGGFPGDAGKVARRISGRSHYRGRGPANLKTGRGPLTDRCDVCGCKMRRLGWKVWTETPTADGIDELNAGKTITRRLGVPGGLIVDHVRYASSLKNARKIASELADELAAKATA